MSVNKMSELRKWWWPEEKSTHHIIGKLSISQEPPRIPSGIGPEIGIGPRAGLVGKSAATTASSALAILLSLPTIVDSSSYEDVGGSTSQNGSDNILLTLSNGNINGNDYGTIPFEDDSWENSGSILFLIIIYGIVVFGGILGNASLVITLCSQSSVRLRNPLLVALCLADLLVAGVSAPSTIVTLALKQKPWTLPTIGCKAIYYLQSMPVAASTISFLMLSLDRYATVKHPSLAQLRQRRYVHTILATLSWIGAGAVCFPILLAYRITTTMVVARDSPIPNHLTLSTCRPDYGSSELQTSFIIIHTVLVFIFPGLGVILNHLGVRRKLCALSLTARAAHGELPLPMPILRRPTHMIIVTGMANAARGVVSNSSDDDNNTGDKNFMMETIIKTSPKSPRVMREIRVQQQRQKLGETTPAPELPLPQTSTLRARRRLANMLVAAAIIFIGCWTPHVFCILWTEFGHKQYCTKTISHFSLLLGYAHSAISPIMYWALNHNTLRQSPCAPFVRFSTAQRFLRTHLRAPTAPPPPSSTNEAALGAFNPRYIKARPKQYRAQASSHYLY